MADKVLEELLVSSEVQTARDRLEDYQAAEAAAENNPGGEQELSDLRAAMVDMPGTVQMLLVAIDRAGASIGEPQYDDESLAGIGKTALEVIIVILVALPGSIRSVNYAWYTAAAAAVLITVDVPHPSNPTPRDVGSCSPSAGSALPSSSCSWRT